MLLIDQSRNPWQMLAEPLSSAEPRLKITALGHPYAKNSHIWWRFGDILTKTSLDIFPAHPVQYFTGYSRIM